MNELPPEVARLVREGRWIEAIKTLRETLGIDLRSAREMIDGYRDGDPPELPTRGRLPMTGQGALPPKVIGMLHSGRRIEAIKELRQQRGLGLKDANDEVVAYLKRHPDLERLNPSGQGRFMAVTAFVVAIIVYKAIDSL